MDIFIIARCLNKINDHNIERNGYLFKINGHFLGKYIKLASVRSTDKLELGEDYLVCAQIEESSQDVIYCSLISAKKISTIKRDFL